TSPVFPGARINLQAHYRSTKRRSFVNMSTKPSKTVLITGGNGVLGSHIAFDIAKAHPEVFFILTARRPDDAQAESIAAQLRDKGITAFEFLTLDLSSFALVKAFAAEVIKK